MFMRIAIALAASIAFSANAAELPKEGTDSYTTAYVVISANTMQQGDRATTVTEFAGISRNDNGGPMFDNMGVRCIGITETVGDVATNRGACTDSDKDGDQVFSTYEEKAGVGKHTFVGGTGKYAGLSGTADFTVTPIRSPDGRLMFLVPHKAQWKRS